MMCYPDVTLIVLMVVIGISIVSFIAFAALVVGKESQ